MSPLPQLKALGARLRELREQRGLGARTVAGMTGLSRTTIQNVEQGGPRRAGQELPYAPESITLWKLATVVAMPDEELQQLAAAAGVRLDPKPLVIGLNLEPVPSAELIAELRRRAEHDPQFGPKFGAELQRVALEVATRQSGRF